MPKKLPLEKVSQILDRVTEGGSYKKIADATGVHPSTVFDLIKDFPLWAFLRVRTED